MSRIVKVARQEPDLEAVPDPTLELMERQFTAALYAIWKARGVQKKIITLEYAIPDSKKPAD